MIKAIMTNYTTKTIPYKNGEYYTRAQLYFDIFLFGIRINSKATIYDITMFDPITSYTDFWEEMIESKARVKMSIIKDRKIF